MPGGGGSARVPAPAAREGGAGAWAAVAGEGAGGAGFSPGLDGGGGRGVRGLRGTRQKLGSVERELLWVAVGPARGFCPWGGWKSGTCAIFVKEKKNCLGSGDVPSPRPAPHPCH